MSDLESLDVAVSPEEKFREYLATKGYRLTPERKRIVDEIFSHHEHFDAEQLVARLTQKSEGRRVSRSTVYRMLALLEEAGLLRKVARTNDREVWEHDYGYPQHDHLICRETGKLIEFQSEELNEILKRVAAEHNFLLEGHRLEVYGRSVEARRAKRRQHNQLERI
ncbi:Fur family transcriptional regulator [Calycomorphotria hydatis]|uniref:Ferric uptake regulation protein n=1 Tax=Calycomorphotria hydatis TaxID=2528027 RepID=A0A517TC37_9PLAN|nr:Fur family transcriptional regulator [Calycomorphotria hydatis]QDT65934.1 Ferric uptake regulation protein [Calycomorphotria hydatis]